MGTKNNPGEFNCYAKAEPDEPLFTLRGKDVSAPYLVEIWTAVRRGHVGAARTALDRLLTDPRVVALKGGECEKSDEALSCAEAMRAWRKMLDSRDAIRVGRKTKTTKGRTRH